MTPFWKSIRKTKTNQPTHQWPLDGISGRQDNAIVEGSAYSFATSTAPSRFSNLTQRLQRTWEVSNTERVTKGAGIDNMADYQKMKALKGITIDLEHALITGSFASGSTSAARRMTGALNYVTSGVYSFASYANYTAMGAALIETLFNGQIKVSWANGGDPDSVLVGPALKAGISAFAGVNSTKFTKAELGAIKNTVGYYEGDFGTVELILSRDMINAAASDCWMLVYQNDGYYAAVLDPIHHIPTEEVGASVSGLGGVIEGEVTLENRKPQHAIVSRTWQNS